MKKKVVMASLALMLVLSGCVRTNPDVKEPEVSELTESEVENTTEETPEAIRPRSRSSWLREALVYLPDRRFISPRRDERNETESGDGPL